MAIALHRVYDHTAAPKGARYLVDRLWPRGIRKEDLHTDGWLKEVAPSNELRKWYAHDPVKRAEFRRRYFAELDQHPEAWQPLLDAARRGPVVLLYSSKETEYNNAHALREYLEAKLKRG